IGHGGRSSTNVSGLLSGDIRIESTAAGNVELKGGSGPDQAAAGIGHGGGGTNSNKVAKTDLLGGGELTWWAGTGSNREARMRQHGPGDGWRWQLLPIGYSH